jgi:hypothetical protein
MLDFTSPNKLEIDLDKEISKLENYLKNSKKILLINHRRMD